jgi:bifunctional ADP-heptose synthase (sugar kinase/adenylyltransferase)
LKRVLLIGDLIVDDYTYGTKLGLSAETPTIVANFKERKRFLGGAGLVARHLLRLGARVTLMSAVQRGFDSERVVVNSSDPPIPEEMERLTIFSFGRIPGYLVTEKHRCFVDEYKLLQYDVRNSAVHTPESQRDFVSELRRVIPYHDLVVACDNRHGTINQHVAQAMVNICRESGVPLYVDSQMSQHESNHHWYKGCKRMFVNLTEAAALSPGSSSIDDAVRRISKDFDCAVLVKLGEDGALECWDGEIERYPLAGPVAAVDTCGAGDAFLAALVVTGDVHAANDWAGRSTTYIGTVVPTVKEATELMEIYGT